MKKANNSFGIINSTSTSKYQDRIRGKRWSSRILVSKRKVKNKSKTSEMRKYRIETNPHNQFIQREINRGGYTDKNSIKQRINKFSK